MVYALIPARGGSKRIPQKNVLDMCGQPMISWTIKTALNAKVFSAVQVTTDSEHIAQVSRDAGATVPQLRPADLADDHSTLDTVIRAEIMSNDILEDWICLIYATAILLKPDSLVLAADMAQEADPETDFIMSLCPYPHPPQRAVRLDKGDMVSMLAAENAMTRTQDLEPLYHDAAQFVFGRRSAWLDGRTVWNSPTKGFALSAGEAIDIDTPDDLAVAAAMLRASQVPEP